MVLVDLILVRDKQVFKRHILVSEWPRAYDCFLYDFNLTSPGTSQQGWSFDGLR